MDNRRLPTDEGNHEEGIMVENLVIGQKREIGNIFSILDEISKLVEKEEHAIKSISDLWKNSGYANPLPLSRRHYMQLRLVRDTLNSVMVEKEDFLASAVCEQNE